MSLVYFYITQRKSNLRFVKSARGSLLWVLGCKRVDWVDDPIIANKFKNSETYLKSVYKVYKEMLRETKVMYWELKPGNFDNDVEDVFDWKDAGKFSFRGSSIKYIHTKLATIIWTYMML